MEKDFELEEMKQQLHILQQRLDKQVEINEKQTRRAIADGMENISRKDKRALFLCILLPLVMPYVFYVRGFSTVFIIVSFLFFSANAARQYYLKFDDKKLVSMSLIETMKRLLRYKKDSRNACIISLPLAFCWAYWFGKEYQIVRGMTNEDMQSLFLAMVIGTSIGTIIGYFTEFRPKMRTIDRLLRQIEEVQGEN